MRDKLEAARKRAAEKERRVLKQHQARVRRAYERGEISAKERDARLKAKPKGWPKVIK